MAQQKKYIGVSVLILVICASVLAWFLQGAMSPSLSLNPYDTERMNRINITMDTVRSTPCPMNDLELCFQITDTIGNIVVTDLNQLFANQYSDNLLRQIIDILYEAANRQYLFLAVGIKGSSACCEIMQFDISSKEFTSTGIMGATNIFFSPTNQYVAHVSDNKTIQLFNLENISEVTERLIIEGSLIASQCGYSNDDYNVEFVDEADGFRFTVFSETEMIDECNFVPLYSDMLTVNG